MKKGKVLKRVGIGIGSFLLAILIIVLVLFLQGKCFDKGNKEINNKENAIWMSYLKDETKLSDIIMPGSHDAGTQSINYLSQTQNYTIKKQLEMGVRYFDLRVRKESDDYYLYHSIFNGDKFIPVVDDIVNFITTNSSETLLLDFQHFDKDSKSDVYNILKEKLVDNNLVLKNNTSTSDLEYISNVTLNDTRGKCVIFFGEGSDYTDNNYIFERNNDLSSKSNMSLNSTYVSKYNKMSSKKYIEEGLPFYINQIKEKINDEGYKGIFVLQGQLTDGLLVLGPYSRERSHDKNMTEYINNLKTSSDLELINVIMRDFLNEDKCNQIISLNANKGNVKNTKTQEFDSIF